MKLEPQSHVVPVTDGAKGIGAAITCEMAGAFALSSHTNSHPRDVIKFWRAPNRE